MSLLKFAPSQNPAHFSLPAINRITDIDQISARVIRNSGLSRPKALTQENNLCVRTMGAGNAVSGHEVNSQTTQRD